MFEIILSQPILVFALAALWFVMGYVWYGVLFWKLWAKIHGMDQLPKEQETKMMQWMWKTMLVEFILNVIMVAGLIFLSSTYGNPIAMAVLIWFAFVMPSIVSVLNWGNDSGKNLRNKLLLTLAYRFIALILAGILLQMFL